MIRLSAFADEAGAAISEQISALVENNIPYIEVRNIDGINVKDMTKTQASEYCKQLNGAGIRVWAIGSPLGKEKLSVPMNDYINTVKHLFDIAEEFGTDKLRVFSFFTDNYKADRDQVISRMRTMCEMAARRNLTLCHENEKHIYGDSPERVVDLLDNVPLLKSVFDPANYLQCEQDIEKCMAMLQHRTYYYHIKDVELSSGSLVPAGYGDGRISELVNAVSGDAVMTLEPHLKVFEGYASIDSESMKNKYFYKSNRLAFDAAAKAMRDVMSDCGYTSRGDRWVKE